MSPLDSIWVIFSTFLVILMQPGFMCLEAGLTQNKNSINVSLKNAIDCCLSFLIYWFIGFGLMFGNSYFGWIGIPDDPSLRTEKDSLIFFLFQASFCATAATIVSGAVAERIRLTGYLIIVLLISLLIYPTFGHWAWGGSDETPGWLRSIGFIDFAGSTVVHSIGGWMALAGVLIVGPRKGLGEGKFIPSNLNFYTLGVFLLFIGWFGFNGGSTLAFNNDVPSILVNTFIGAAAGGTVMTLYFLILKRTLSVESTLLGIIAGLVGVTAGCHILSSFGAFAAGGSAALLCYASDRVLRRMNIDDVVSSFPAHAVAGAWGTLCVALLGDLEGFAGATRLQQLGIQCLGIGVCFLWAFGLSFIILKTISLFFNFRVDEEQERIGLNISEHQAYTHSQLLLDEMQEHQESGNLSKKVHEDAYSEIGQIAAQYNRVIERIDSEQKKQMILMKRIQKQSRENEMIITSASEAIIAMDLQHKIFKWNPEAITIFEWSEEDALGKNFFELVFPELLRTQSGLEYLSKIQNMDPDVFSIRQELHLQKKSGYAFMAEMMLQKMDNGETNYICAFIRDITDRKNYEDSLIKMRDSALSVATMKSEFLATMSHEIRTPLNGIIGFADLLKDSKIDKEQEQFVNTISKSGKNLLSIINTILDYSKADANKMVLNPITFELPTQINEVIQAFAYKRSPDFELGSYIAPNVKPLIYSDQQLLRQILDNLMGNAIKFTDSGTVMIKVLKIGEEGNFQHLRFEVTDTGIGIPMNKQSKLFDTFSQVDSSQNRKYGGTGLGLAYCKKIIELMNGQIGFTSEFGKGSTFWFVIKVESEELAVTPTIKPLDSQKIAFWDPNKEMRFLLQSYLNDWGAEAIKLKSETDLYLHLQKHRDLNCLILDENLKDEQGVSYSQLAQERWPKLNILVLGQLESSKDHHLLKKPFAQEDLLMSLLNINDLKTETIEINKGSIVAETTPQKQHLPELPNRILYVEDNEDNRELLSTYLKKWKIPFDLAENGQQGVEKCTQNFYHVILMDIQMPIMDGITASKHIRELSDYSEHQHIVALTASKPTELEDKGDLNVFNEVFQKPINFPMIKNYLLDSIQEVQEI